MDSCDKIVIFGQAVQVPPNRVAYNAIRMDFIGMANEAAAQYEKLYTQDGSIQKVINGLGEQMHDCLAPTLDHCITTLIQHGVIDMMCRPLRSAISPLQNHAPKHSTMYTTVMPK